MRFSPFLCTIGLIALGIGAALLLAAPDDAAARFDPYSPSTLLPIAAAGFREIEPLIRTWFDTALTELRDVLQRTPLSQSLPR